MAKFVALIFCILCVWGAINAQPVQPAEHAQDVLQKQSKPAEDTKLNKLLLFPLDIVPQFIINDQRWVILNGDFE